MGQRRPSSRTFTMRKFAEACEQIAGTTKKIKKIATVADSLKSPPPKEASVAAIFLSGRPFPMWEETTLQVGGRLLWQVIEQLSGKSAQELTTVYSKHGDLGAVAEQVLCGDGRLARAGRAKLGSAEKNVDTNSASEPGLSIQEVQAA